MEFQETAYNERLIRNLCKFIEDDVIFFRKCRIDEISSRRILIGYYDILKSCAFTIALANKYKIPKREELFVFLKNIGEGEISDKFSGFSRLRDELVYSGVGISKVEVKFLIGEINESIRKLRHKYLKEFV